MSCQEKNHFVMKLHPALPARNAFVCSETDRPGWNLTAINLEGELLPGTIWSADFRPLPCARLPILTPIFSAPERMRSAMATARSPLERGEHSLV